MVHWSSSSAQVGIGLLLASLCCAAAPPQDRVFDILYIPQDPAGDDLMKAEPPQIRARAKSPYRVRASPVEVKNVREADQLIAKHTLILLDLGTASRAAHETLLREVLNVVRWHPASDLTIIALGPSPGNLERLETSEGDVESILVWGEQDLKEFLKCRASQLREWKLYWVPQATRSVAESLALWLGLKAAPMRLIWASDNFRWFAYRRLADYAFVTSMGVTAFPVLSQRIGFPADDEIENAAGARRLGQELGGFQLPGRMTGDGRVLAEGLQATSRGRTFRFGVRLWPGDPQSFELRLDAGRDSKAEYRRPAELNQRQVTRLRPGQEKESPLAVSIPHGEFEARLEPAAAGAEGFQLVLNLPLKAGAKEARCLQVLVGPGTAEDPLRSLRLRREIPWGQVKRTPQGAIASVPLPGGLPASLRVIVFDEVTKWTAVKTLTLTAPDNTTE